MCAAVLLFLYVFRNLIKQSFRICPSKTGVGDRLPVAVLADFLAAWLNVAFDHQALDQILDLSRMSSAVKNFFGKCAKFFRDTKSELKKVVWPSKEDVKTNTVVVLVTVAIAAVVMILLDAIFGGILGLIIGA